MSASDVEVLFAAACALDAPKTETAALVAYRAILAGHPHHAPSMVNVGNLLYGRRDYAGAESWFRRATEASPDYALAWFDLGNALDELAKESAADARRTGHETHGERDFEAESAAAYGKAVTIEPGYADAHYNLALALEGRGERRRALRHWSAYLRLEPRSAQAAAARGRVKELLRGEGLRLVKGTA